MILKVKNGNISLFNWIQMVVDIKLIFLFKILQYKTVNHMHAQKWIFTLEIIKIVYPEYSIYKPVSVS